MTKRIQCRGELSRIAAKALNRMPWAFSRLGLILGATVLTACSSMQYPTSQGSHPPFDYTLWSKDLRVAVVANDDNAEEILTLVGKRMTDSLVDDDTMRKALKEHDVSLESAPLDDSKLLAAAKAVPVDLLLVADVHLINPKASLALGVTVRGIRVDTGEAVWSGSADATTFISNPDEGIRFLTEIATRHALCPVERGYRWIEFDQTTIAKGTGGCRRTGGTNRNTASSATAQ